MSNLASCWLWLAASPPPGATSDGDGLVSAAWAAGAGVRSGSANCGLPPRSSRKETWPPADGQHQRAQLPASPAGARTPATARPGRPPRRCGPLTPFMSQKPAASTGAVQAASARTAIGKPRTDASRRSPVRPPADSVRPRPSAAAAAASSRPAAATASATPGHAVTGWPPGRRDCHPADRAARCPGPAARRIQPETISFSRLLDAAGRRGRPAASAALTQYGGRPGPPGLSSSRDLAGRLADGEAGLLESGLQQQPDGMLEQLEQPGQQQHRRRQHDDGQVARAAPRPDRRSASAGQRPRRPRPSARAAGRTRRRR